MFEHKELIRGRHKNVKYLEMNLVKTVRCVNKYDGKTYLRNLRKRRTGHMSPGDGETGPCTGGSRGSFGGE